MNESGSLMVMWLQNVRFDSRNGKDTILTEKGRLAEGGVGDNVESGVVFLRQLGGWRSFCVMILGKESEGKSVGAAGCCWEDMLRVGSTFRRFTVPFGGEGTNSTQKGAEDYYWWMQFCVQESEAVIYPVL